MGLVVLEGLVILVLVLTGFRRAVFAAVPTELKTAISVGIGLFITFIGLVDAGIVRTPAGAAVPVELGIGGRLAGWPTLVFCFGLIAIIVLSGSFERVGFVSSVLFIFTLLLADFFDTMGTIVAIGAEAGLLDEHGDPPNTQRILVVDSIGAAAGGAASVSSNTSFIESASGVGEGARTGLASVVTGVLFLLATFLAPVVSIIPYEAATPALVFVGFLMMTQDKSITWDDVEIAIPAFLTIALMPFSYSITAGIGAGFLTFVIIKVARGKIGQVHPLMWIVAALFVVYFFIEPIEIMLGVD